MRRTSRLEEMMAWQLDVAEMEYIREFSFAPPRKWRFDFVVNSTSDPLKHIAVECEGITRYGPAIGRHQSAKGYEADLEKYNCATVLGWRVIRVSERHIKSGQAMEWIRELLG